MAVDNSKLPRGLRNNNPGNIEKTKPGRAMWNGEIESTDPRFAQFVDIKYGYRAMFKLIERYILKLGKTNLTDIINTWAPPVENNTHGYVERVAKESGVDPHVTIGSKDKDKLTRIVAAMSLVENGRPAVPNEVEAGWKLYAKQNA